MNARTWMNVSTSTQNVRRNKKCVGITLYINGESKKNNSSSTTSYERRGKRRSTSSSSKKTDKYIQESCETCVCFLFHSARCVLLSLAYFLYFSRGFFTISICIFFSSTRCEFIRNENFHRINKSTHRKINTHWIICDCTKSHKHVHKHKHTLRPNGGEK